MLIAGLFGVVLYQVQPCGSYTECPLLWSYLYTILFPISSGDISTWCCLSVSFGSSFLHSHNNIFIVVSCWFRCYCQIWNKFLMCPIGSPGTIETPVHESCIVSNNILRYGKVFQFIFPSKLLILACDSSLGSSAWTWTQANLILTSDFPEKSLTSEST